MVQGLRRACATKALHQMTRLPPDVLRPLHIRREGETVMFVP